MKVLGTASAILLATLCFSVPLLPDFACAAAAQQPAAGSLNGVWVNVDPHTRGLVRVAINGNRIHPYGACQPDPCDWGVLKAKSFSGSVDSSNQTALEAKQTTSFSRVNLTLSLEPDGRLRVEAFTHFTDNSGRADYHSENFFVRGRAPYQR